jgi:DNA modification methylase
MSFSFPKSIYAVRDCLRAADIGSRKNAIVLDFFAGSGTTGVVAARVGRNATLVEHNPVGIEKTLLRLARLNPRPRVRLWRFCKQADFF